MREPGRSGKPNNDKPLVAITRPWAWAGLCGAKRKPKQPKQRRVAGDDRYNDASVEQSVDVLCDLRPQICKSLRLVTNL